MAVETVRVFVVDQQTPAPAAIENVLVKVFDVTGTTFITQDYTDANGIADFSLDGDDPAIDYTIRLSKTGIAFDGALGDDNKSPQAIEVYSPPSVAPTSTNDFQVVGETFERPTAVDSRKCRASGYFYRGDGQPYDGLDILISPVFKPSIVDNNAVMGGIIQARTDADGYFELDLYRNGIYKFIVETMGGDCPRTVTVPDASSANIVHLLFPVVSSVVFDPASLSLAVDEDADITVEVTASDGRILEGTASEDVTYTSADETIATVSTESDKLVITAIAPGTTQIDVARADESVVVIPDGTITYTPLSITVS